MRVVSQSLYTASFLATLSAPTHGVSESLSTALGLLGSLHVPAAKSSTFSFSLN